MNIASRFQTPLEDTPQVTIHVDGNAIMVSPGISLAAALLSYSGGPTRMTAKGSERTAFCMMGVCFECLVDVDGTPNTQACMITVREGMVVKRQIGLRRLNGGGDV
ncbi:(2Fe-2S)-binding protein [Aliiroseovarius sp. F47248L]|uniref:(2Fe-2S)-binding protein n=1 Tax=Aliiroseovarius sp. F47248L TaxID=2926420 RepID=UPI001FF6FAFD|nr:(2Fe-2S)-binding protein [Aliiroseovarius sp. F47248L]MCK0139637.1 (2Fe-2S)-binding protein [Aliiroseovarius sp. F47248L]